MKSVIGADPYVLFDKKSGYYYCYATSNTKHNKTFYIYKSKDLINWEFVDYALDTLKNNWGKDWYWAPECYYNPYNNHYYLFYSARLKDELTKEYFYEDNYEENCKIGVAVSTSPEGPFINITDRPIDYYPYDPNYLDVDKVYKNTFSKDIDLSKRLSAPKGVYLSSIDVNLFFDEDRIYMFYSRCCYRNCIFDEEYQKFIEESNIVAVELDTSWWFDKEAKTMPTIKKEYLSYNNNQRQDKFTNIITYHNEKQAWENGHINDYDNNFGSKRNRRWSEGSTTFTKMLNGEKVYCITYSCNNYQNALYGVGIAFSKNALGPYKKYEKNPIIHQIKEESLYSTGHGTIIEKNGEMYYFLHGRDNVEHDRTLYLAKININSTTDVSVDKVEMCKLIEE